MKKVLFAVSLGLMICPNGAAQNDMLIGTWRLVSAVRTDLATDDIKEPYGTNPHGFLTYGREGRMQAIIASDRRPKPSQSNIDQMTDEERHELLRTMSAYAGTYTFDGKIVTHHVDISWNEVYTGTDQVSDVQLDEGTAILTTRPTPDPRSGRRSATTLIWKRVR
ncbi:MAG: lipocalin-like domain-containing protein [Acidobacteria bacterium]|nr:lipocalin-like domain-containing protein [Acidobacteriota bacterium]